MSKVARLGYLVVSWLLFIAVLVQVFLAGMVYVARRMSSQNHMTLGHTFVLAILTMIILAFLGQLPRNMKRQTLLLFGVYFVQVYGLMWFVRESAPSVAALHPVLALVVFGLTLSLAVQAWRLVQQDEESAKLRTQNSPIAADLNAPQHMEK